MKSIVEIWRDIKDYEGLYQVSNLGRVRNSRTGRILKPSLNNDYLIVHLCKSGKRKSYKVHRLVAEAFIPNPENKPCIDHINTYRDDNRIENLKWVTYKENQNNPLTKEHLSEKQIGYKNHQYGKYGKEHNRSKPVLQFDLNGNFIKEWECAMQIKRELSFSQSNICMCCNGQKNNYNGYIWKYA